MWQCGESLGVICHDHELQDVYFTQHDSAEFQLTQIRSWRFITAQERNAQISLFLRSYLVYTEITDLVSSCCLGKCFVLIV